MERHRASDSGRACGASALSAFLDSNTLIRHLTGDPPEMAARATAALAEERQLLLTDLVLAECVYVLESFHEVERQRVAELMRSAVCIRVHRNRRYTVVPADPGSGKVSRRHGRTEDTPTIASLPPTRATSAPSPRRSHGATRRWACRHTRSKAVRLARARRPIGRVTLRVVGRR